MKQNRREIVMNKLHMKLGQNIGEILLDIAQTEIQNGNPERAISIYVNSLIGFTAAHAIRLLKNEYVLITSKDNVSVELTDWENERIANRDNIIDWNLWLQSKLDSLMGTVLALSGIQGEFEKSIRGDVLDYNIIEPVIEHFGIALAKQVGVHNIAAKLIAGDGFSNLNSNWENIWYDLCLQVENGDAEKYQKALYFIIKYVDNIRILHKEYMGFINSYLFLLKYNLAERPAFIEMKIESILHKLKEFANTAKGYYHPLCNTKLYEYKESVYDDILSTDYGKEYCRYGIIEKNIMDGYDAGWLSPDGKFYGENGSTSSMIHLRIAETLSVGDLDGDRRLEQKGWMKIHHNEIYGAFFGRADEKDDCHYQYCPTDVQVKMICDYVDNFFNGMFYNKPQIVAVSKPISTYKLRQMDKIMLHKAFTI